MLPPKRFILFSLLLLATQCRAETDLPPLPDTCLQAVVVSASDWSSPAGELRRWEREPGGAWRPTGSSWRVRLGKRGLSWGRGLHQSPAAGPQKREGDQTAPAGVFRLGPAFGYGAAPPPGTRMPWKQSTDRDYFVDDPQSPDYNRWVQLPPDRAAFRFAEVMRRTDDLYEFGIVVQHNMAPVQPGAGSAIFLHVWSGPESSTAGCTAMDRANLLTLLPWLDPAKEPLLVIAPEDALPALRLAPDRVGP